MSGTSSPPRPALRSTACRLLPLLLGSFGAVEAAAAGNAAPAPPPEVDARPMIPHDRNGDGRVDQRDYPGPGGELVLQENDSDYDGIFEARTFFQGGVPTRIEIDMDGDGRPEMISNLGPGGVVNHIERDQDGDGRLETTEYLRADGTVRRRLFDRDGNGKSERIDYLSPQGELVLRVEDRNSDGILDTWLHYDMGILVSRSYDTDGDGNPDRDEMVTPGE